MDVEIRTATVADFETLSELFEEADRLHCDHLPDLFRKPRGAARERSYVRSLIANPDVGFFVAVVDAMIVGTIILMVRETPSFPILVPRRYALVDLIVVREAFQIRGIGRRLMEQGERWARERGLEAVELTVFEFNKAAQVFYARLDYETISRRMIKRLDSQKDA